jgi:hypothetical protein
MAFPVPRPGLVIRYDYLWLREYRLGREEGAKTRPCAVLLAVTDAGGETKAVVLPVTHSPPSDPAVAVEIPAATKRRLGLDDQRSWIILNESNRFVWPGPDLRPARPGDPNSVAYGYLPKALYEHLREKWLALYQTGRAQSVARTE